MPDYSQAHLQKQTAATMTLLTVPTVLIVS